MYLTSKIVELQDIFTRLTYANFDREVIGITVFQTDYPKAHFDKFNEEEATYYISLETKKEIDGMYYRVNMRNLLNVIKPSY